MGLRSPGLTDIWMATFNDGGGVLFFVDEVVYLKSINLIKMWMVISDDGGGVFIFVDVAVDLKSIDLMKIWMVIFDDGGDVLAFFTVYFVLDRCLFFRQSYLGSDGSQISRDSCASYIRS